MSKTITITRCVSRAHLYAFLLMGWTILNDRMYSPHGAYSVLVGK